MNTKLLLSLSGIILSSLGLTQYCTNVGPTSNIDSNLEWLILNGATGSINYTGCPGVTGLQYNSNQTVYLNAGSSYPMSLQFGTCGGNFSSVGEAWIDFNNNQIFEPLESIGTWQGLPPTAPSNFVINVPALSSTGLTRMRVVQYEGGTLPINPCATFTWGSTTDFNVYIQNGVDCSAYLGNDFDNPREVTNVPFSENHATDYCYTSQNQAYPSPDVFYKVKVPAGVSSLTASLCGSAFDTFITATEKDGNVINFNDDSPSCGVQSEVEINVIGLDSIYFIVEGWGNQSGDYTILIGEGTLDVQEVNFTTFKFYPNPATNDITIHSQDVNVVEILDLSGKIVSSHDVSSQNTINIEHLSAGSYLLRVQHKESNQTAKFVKL
jgi:hypothetical protein